MSKNNEFYKKRDIYPNCSIKLVIRHSFVMILLDIFYLIQLVDISSDECKLFIIRSFKRIVLKVDWCVIWLSWNVLEEASSLVEFLFECQIVNNKRFRLGLWIKWPQGIKKFFENFICTYHEVLLMVVHIENVFLNKGFLSHVTTVSFFCQVSSR